MKKALYVLYLVLIVIVLIPKEKIYYTFESILAKNHIFLTGESINDYFFYLDADNASVVLDHLNVASVEHIRLSAWLLLNRLTISNVVVSPQYRTFFPGKIDEIVVSYSILHPLSLQIHGQGDFGECNGMVDMIEQKTRVVFEATSNLRNYPLLVFKLHREKEGLVYESSF